MFNIVYRFNVIIIMDELYQLYSDISHFNIIYHHKMHPINAKKLRKQNGSKDYIQVTFAS